MSVLVTHAQIRTAYYVTRCLAKHGIKVTCASEFPLAATFFSRYCTDHFTYPSPWKQPEQFVKKIIEEIEKRDIEVLMPVHREGYILAKYKDQLERYVRFPSPAYSKIISVNDKKRMREMAKEVGIRIPKTITPNNLDQVREAKSNLRFPVLVKPHRGHGGIGISKVNDPSQLPHIYLKTIRRFNISKPTDYPIIQEFIQGKTLEMGMLFNHGKLVAKFSYQVPRLFFRLEYENPESTDTLHRLGKHLEWHGRIHAGFIIEEDTHRSYLVDINPRHSGVVGYAIMSGVEFPYLLYRIAIDEEVEPVLEYKRGTTSRWLWGDLYNLMKYIRRGELDQALKVLTCRAPLDFWDPSDPIPFLTLPAYYLTQLFRTGTMQPLIEKY